MIKGIQTYLNQVLQELRQVKSPNRQRALRMTLIVLVICAMIGAYIGLLDYGLTKLITTII